MQTELLSNLQQKLRTVSLNYIAASNNSFTSLKQKGCYIYIYIDSIPEGTCR